MSETTQDRPVVARALVDLGQQLAAMRAERDGYAGQNRELLLHLAEAQADAADLRAERDAAVAERDALTRDIAFKDALIWGSRSSALYRRVVQLEKALKWVTQAAGDITSADSSARRSELQDAAAGIVVNAERALNDETVEQPDEAESALTTERARAERYRAALESITSGHARHFDGCRCEVCIARAALAETPEETR